MSFQLIHTSYPHLLDSTASGYGTVARSEDIPPLLVSRLNAISIMREPNGGACTTGPQFSYRIINTGSTAWHVLTCVQGSGADYSGRACHTAHHLVISQQEVTKLLGNEMRPTPAGISLALHRSGFWIQKWQGEPRFIIGEPPLRPEHFPDATVQPTWKHLTGHKSNARAFYTPPYHRECLVTVHRGTSSLEVLGLFHESDWLTPGLGWGCTYTTETDDADSFAETLRMVVCPESPLVRRAIRTGHPVLHIAADMELAVEPEQREPAQSELADFSGTENQIPVQQHDKGVRILPRSTSHYHYTEEPDWMQYDVAMPRSNPYALPLAIFGAATLITGLTFGVWLGLTQPVQQLDSYLNETIHNLSGNGAASALDKLTSLVTAPYNHDATVRALNELMLIPENQPEDSIIIECAVLLNHISENGVNHAAALKRICECARQLQLPANALERLYIMEVVHSLTPDEWYERINEQSHDEWLALKKKEPALFLLFTEGLFCAYNPERSDADSIPHTELASAEIADSAPPQQPAANNAAPQVIGATTAMCGHALPDTISELINHLPLTINGGMYCVSTIRKGDTLQATRSLNLSAAGYHLYITPTDKEGEYLIKPEHKEGRKSELPEVTLTIRNNKLQKIRCKEGEAVIAFPVPGKGDTLSYVIAAPRIAIPIPTEKPYSFPSADKLNLEITNDQLSVTPPSSAEAAYKLQLRKKPREFPWKIGKNDIEYIQFSINLPSILERHPNAVAETCDESSAYRWKSTRIFNDILQCELEHSPNFPKRMEHVFDQIANAPCCGNDSVKNKEMTLAHLYYIAQKLSSEKLKRSQREKLCDEYIDMLGHRKFNAELQKIMRNSPILLLSVEDATALTGAARRMRSNLKETLLDSPSSQLITKHICKVLSDSIKEAYKQELSDFKRDKEKKLLLILKKLSIGKDGELMWHFHLQNGK